MRCHKNHKNFGVVYSKTQCFFMLEILLGGHSKSLKRSFPVFAFTLIEVFEFYYVYRFSHLQPGVAFLFESQYRELSSRSSRFMFDSSG